MDSIPIGYLIAILVILILLSAFFSASETATMALNRYRLADQANKKNRKAILLQKLIDEPDQLLGTILLGNNLVNNAIVAITSILAWQLYGQAGVAASTAIITIVILVFAEIPPKTYAAIYPERIAYFAAFLLNVLLKVLYPVVWMVSVAARVLEHTIPQEDKKLSADPLDADQLSVAVQTSTGGISDEQRALLLGILDLGAHTVESAMVPHQKVQAIDLDDEMSDIIEGIETASYSRVPVYNKSFDLIEGVLEIRKLLQRYSLTDINKDRIREVIKPPLYLPEEAELFEQINRLQNSHQNMGLVIDEYGVFMGIVTLHDMLAEIAGNLGSHDFGVIREERGSFIVNARMNVRDINRILKIELPTGEIHTLNGLILEHSQDIPPPGTTITLNGYPVETVRVSESAVITARIKPKIEDREPEAANLHSQ